MLANFNGLVTHRLSFLISHRLTGNEDCFSDGQAEFGNYGPFFQISLLGRCSNNMGGFSEALIRIKTETEATIVARAATGEDYMEEFSDEISMEEVFGNKWSLSTGFQKVLSEKIDPNKEGLSEQVCDLLADLAWSLDINDALDGSDLDLNVNRGSDIISCDRGQTIYITRSIAEFSPIQLNNEKNDGAVSSNIEAIFDKAEEDLNFDDFEHLEVALAVY